MRRPLKDGTAGVRKRRSVRRLAWLAVALVLSLSLMPLARPSPAVAGHHRHGHHHHHHHHDSALADAGSGHSGHRPAGGAPKGCAGHEDCPFCTAHPGYSPPPPQMAALPLPAGFAVAAGPAAIEAPLPAPQFLTSLRPRAPPPARV